MPPIIKCRRHYVMAYASVSVNIWFPSVVGTPGSIDLIFLWLIQDGHYGSHLGFRFHRLEDKCLGWLIRFLCGSLGVTRGRFLSMISSAAHPRWPLRPPSWIWFPLIRRQMPGSINPIFLWLEEGSFQSSQNLSTYQIYFDKCFKTKKL
jgi:hypothetical protein